jgi:hypothetical protein
MMKQQKGTGDSFGTFLEGLKRREESRATPGGAPLKILTILLEQGPQPVPDLMTKSTAEFGEFAAALKSVREAGLVSMTGPAGREEVKLTSDGEQIARMARLP